MDPYVVEGMEVLIVRAPHNALEGPTASESAILDQYFAGPTCRWDDGTLIQLLGSECEGIMGGVMMYRTTPLHAPVDNDAPFTGWDTALPGCTGE